MLYIIIIISLSFEFFNIQLSKYFFDIIITKYDKNGFVLLRNIFKYFIISLHLCLSKTSYILSSWVIFKQLLNNFQLVDQYLHFFILCFLIKLIALAFLVYPALLVLAQVDLFVNIHLQTGLKGMKLYLLFC